MEKIALSLVLASSLTMAADVAKDQVKLAADIEVAKADKKAAEDKIKALKAQLPQDQEIKTHVKLGYIKTDGNTDTETFSLDGSFKKAWGKNSGSIIFDGQYGSDKNVINKKKYFTELEYAYLFTKTLSFTYTLGYKVDKFSSYDYQAYTGPGLKWNTYKSDKQKLNLEGDILYSQDVLQVVTPPDDDTNTYGSYKAKLTYELKIVDDLKFNQEFSYRAAFDDADNYFIFSDSSLSSKISDIFSAGISYKVDYTNLVAQGKVRSDNTLAAFLSLDY